MAYNEKRYHSTQIEVVARDYHEMCREMVNSGIGMITKPTQPYIEWDDLTTEMQLGRLFIAKKIIDKYNLWGKVY